MAVRERNISLYALFDRETDERKCEFVFDFLEEFRDAPLVDQVFESGSLSVGSVPVFDKHTKDCSRNRYAFGRFDEDSRIFCKLLVPGNAGQFDAKIDSGFDPLALIDSDGHKAYVVRIRNGADRATAFKRNIELSRQVIHVAIVQDVVMNGFCERACVD